jgi:hypothetical protein
MLKLAKGRGRRPEEYVRRSTSRFRTPPYLSVNTSMRFNRGFPSASVKSGRRRGVSDQYHQSSR